MVAQSFSLDLFFLFKAKTNGLDVIRFDVLFQKEFMVNQAE